MTLIGASNLTSYDPALTSSSVPPVNAAAEPAEIRNGNAKAKQAYQEALGFEEMLMQQLTTQLASTVTGSGDSGSTDGSSGDSSGSSDSSGASGGILGSDPSTSAFASLIPTALTQSLMSSGGVGIADNLAHALDPQIGTPQGEATPAAKGSS
jgi:Rod binding domain-containing protein